MGPNPRVQFNPTDDPDSATTATATATAAPSQETTSTETTQFAAERTRVRMAEAEAEGAPPVQKPRKAVSVPVTTTVGTTSQTTTTSQARALVERIGNEAGEDSRPFQMRRIAALMTECEDTITSDAIDEARRIHWRNPPKSKKQSSKSCHAPMRRPDP